MRRPKNNLDEMQEQKLLRIEHNGFWLAFWGLAVLIALQKIPNIENRIGNTTGEFILLLCLSAYLVFACIKNGIWDRRLKPNLKTNMMISFISSIVAGTVILVSSYIKYEKLYGSIASGIIVFMFTFGLCIALLTFSASLYKKRIHTLEEDTEEPEGRE